MLPNKNTRLAALGIILFTITVLGVAEAESDVAKVESALVPQIGGDEELSKQHCDDTPETLDACRSFIKGFLQGALLTDTAILESMYSDNNASSFTERAIKTRISQRAEPPTTLAGFCLPANRTILDLANETLDHVKHSERNSKDLAQNVYNSLKKDYPCGT